MSRTAAAYMAEALAQAGVERIYGVVGDSLNGFTDALRRLQSIEWIHVRHEEGAAFAAGAEAHLTGKLAVCAGSCGPGNLHLINGLYDAHRSQVPVLAIAAHIPSIEIGIDFFQATFPRRQVISLSGDGGFTMMMGDFVTLIQHKLPVKIVVLNNGTLGFVELEMKATGFLDNGCDLENPNFADMAQAMGVKGVRVEAPQDVHGAVQEVLRHDGPALLDVVSARQELVMPPTITFDEAHKFGVFMLKAVLDGRAGELIDLAKVNLLR
jgi:thiamine pyrophosphate-dependent acetolactate synthase large subunit-like protein